MKKVFKLSLLLTMPFLLSSCALLKEVLQKVSEAVESASGAMEEATLKEVSFDVFKEAARQAYEDGHPFTSAVVDGHMTMVSGENSQSVTVDKESYNYDGETWSYEGEVTASKEVGKSLVSMHVYNTFPEDDGETKYYVGNGFRVTIDDENQNGDVHFNKYGLITSYQYTQNGDDSSQDISFKIVYSK